MKIHYTDQGKGNPVILIHGFCEAKEMWRAFEKELSLHYRVICPDLPGFGDSRLEGDEMTMEAMAVLLQDWMEGLKINAPAVIGHSMGGYVTLALAELMGVQLRGIGLFHSTAFPDDAEKVAIRNRTIEFVKKHGVDTFVSSFVPQLFPELRRAEMEKKIQEVVSLAKKTSQNGLIAFTKAMRDRKERLDVLRDFKGRKLFIAGTLDGAVPIAASRKQQEMVDDYHELPETGHMGMFERESETLDFVKDFLSKTFS